MAGMDVQAFLTGFLGEKARQISKRKEKAEEEMDFFKRNRDQFIQAADQRKQLRKNAGTLVNRLKDYGASDDMIAAAASEGPNGLTDLSRTLSTAVSKQGLDFVKENIGLYADASVDKVSLGEDYDINTILDKAYGINSYAAGDYKPTQEYGFFDKLFGKNAMDEAYAELDKEAVYDGMSLYDLRQFAQSKAYNEVGGDSYIKYLSPMVFSPDDISSEMVELNRVQSQYESQPEFVAAEDGIEKAKENIAKYTDADGNVINGFETQLQDAKKSLQENMAARDAVIAKYLDPYVQGRNATYAADTYLLRMGSFLDTMTGTENYAQRFSASDEPLTEQSVSASDEKPKPPKAPDLSENPVIAKIQELVDNTYVGFKVTEDGLQLVYRDKLYSVEQTKAFFEKNAASLGDLNYENVLKSLKTTGDSIGEKEGLSWWEKGFTRGANEKGVPTEEDEPATMDVTEGPTGSGLSWWEKGFTVGANEAGVPEAEDEDEPEAKPITGPVVEDMTYETAPDDIKEDYLEWLMDNDVTDSPEAFKQFIEEELPIVEG